MWSSTHDSGISSFLYPPVGEAEAELISQRCKRERCYLTRDRTHGQSRRSTRPPRARPKQKEPGWKFLSPERLGSARLGSLKRLSDSGSRAASSFHGRTAAEGENEKYRRLERKSLLNLGNELFFSSPLKEEKRPEAKERMP
ncbi:hypothetical protein SRHO_G00330910 [Serrasalmus rhombeus]